MKSQQPDNIFSLKDKQTTEFEIGTQNYQNGIVIKNCLKTT